MDPISNLIEQTEKKIGHSLHPALVGLPIGALMVSTVSDVLGALTRDEQYDAAARISMGVGLIGVAGAALTGMHDYSYIPRDSDSHGIATEHALGNAIVGSLFATSYILRSRRAPNGRRPGLIARLLGLAGGGLMVYTAWLGGKLVEERGEAVQPVMRRLEPDRPLVRSDGR